ncbi:hypothetical protein CASFOL_037581 [Castilleja foliolosa]|uniref:Protein kinase domain-containing protein n=1 Tax=Castilleja foliolosa TaxID=1961234 RepID=A0ABD3BMR8_9LAMI
MRIASWGGTQVAVKIFWEGTAEEHKVRAFRDELSLLQKIRHPNVVQFLGAVTQSSPMMIVAEYLPKGDLHEYLKRKGAVKPAKALRFAMAIARGNELSIHEHKPESIIHRDLEPSNILRDDSGHLKVADFGVSKLLIVANSVKEDRPIVSQDTAYGWDAKYWVEGTIVGVDTNKEFWYLSCKICTRKVEKVDGILNCAHCQEMTYIDIYRYSLEVKFVDESGRATLVLCDQACTELIGKDARDVVALQGESVKTLPISVDLDIVGRKGLFEVIVTPDNNDAERFEVSRLTLDKEILDLYRDKYCFYQEACTELIGKDARDVVALQGESVKTLPISVDLDIVGRKGLFEVIVTPDNNDAERFEVSRLTLDKEILDLYRDKYCFYQESSPDHPSFPNDSTYTSPDDLDTGYSSADQTFVVCDEEAEEQEALNAVEVEVSTDQENMTAAPRCIASEGTEATIKEPSGSNHPDASPAFKKGRWMRLIKTIFPGKFSDVQNDIPELIGDNYKVWRERVLLQLGWMDIDYAIRKDEPVGITETSSPDQR